MNLHRQKPRIVPKPLRVGFVPLCDCAPLIMAQELGLFEKHGLQVQLNREVGWATVRDKVIYGELDAAHALAPMVFAASLGLGSAQAPCVTGLVLSLEGNAITLGESLRNAMRGGVSFKSIVRERGQPLIFGIPFLYCSHHFLLRSWLRSHGLTPGRDVHLVVVPPPQMPANLKAGHLDGYCVGEPWNAVATNARFGWRAATSAEIEPQHPEKVLMVRREFSETRAEEHERLIAALLEACHYCATAGNRTQIVETLGRSQYINIPLPALRESFDGGVPFIPGAASASAPDAVHEPSADKAVWILDRMIESGLLPDAARVRKDAISGIFRADIYQKATRQYQPHETIQTIPHLAH